MVFNDDQDRVLYSASERIRAALALRSNSIGHAIYAAGDPELIGEIRESGALVELCPSSARDF